MTERWVSQAKHYCKFCKCWTQGDPMSIKLHEATNHHKNSIKRLQRTAERDKERSEANDRRLANQLRQIETAAAASLAMSVGGGSASTIGVARPPGGIGPQLPGRETHKVGAAGAAGIAGIGMGTGISGGMVPQYYPPAGWNMPQMPPATWNAMPSAIAPPPPAPPPPAPPAPPKVAPPPPPAPPKVAPPPPPVGASSVEHTAGCYQVRGQWYLQGDFFEDELVQGAECEAVYGEDEEWTKATVQDLAEADGGLLYVVKFENGDTSTVEAADIRLLVDRPPAPVGSAPVPPPRPPPMPSSEPAEAAAPAPPVTEATPLSQSRSLLDLDEGTGLGKWQTVAVEDTEAREQAAEARAQEAKAEEEAAARAEAEAEQQALATRKKPITATPLDEDHEDSFAVTNPFGGKYRGVDLEAPADDTPAEPVDDEPTAQSDNGPKVEFKKRKVPNHANFRKRQRL